MYEPDAAAVAFLLGAGGQGWLATADRLPLTAASRLSDLAKLRDGLPANLAAAVLEQASLRRRAAAKFSRAAQMLFSDAALQQATSEVVGQHRASRFAGLRVADLTCGIGGDSLAIGAQAAILYACDLDHTRLRLARHNLAAYGLAALPIQADALRLPLKLSDLDAVFADPGRRSGERRIFAPSDYNPPLAALVSTYRGMAVGLKVAPGINYEQLAWVDEVEIVSLNGEVKEAVLWTGGLATTGVRRRATILTASPNLCLQTSISFTDADAPADCPVGPVGRYLYEPDGAIIRAGLVRHYAHQHGLWQLEPLIAYLSGDRLLAGVRAFAVEEAAPYSLKRLTARLRELHVGVAEIKKRGLDIDPDDLRKRLKLSGPHSRTIILTRVGNQPMMYICVEEKAAAEGSVGGLP